MSGRAAPRPAGRSGVPPAPLPGDRTRAAGRTAAGRWTSGWGPALVLALPALPSALWPDAARWLELDRGRLAAGEVWRLVTCHWTHWSLDHLLWDLGAFAVLAALCWRLHAVRTLGALAAAALLIPLAVWSLCPELERYRGLSGLDAALFVLLAALLSGGSVPAPPPARDHPREPSGSGRLRDPAGGRSRGQRRLPPYRLLAVGLLFAFAGKVLYEVATGTALFVDTSTGFVPVPLAHLVGGACGGAAALASLRRFSAVP